MKIKFFELLIIMGMFGTTELIAQSRQGQNEPQEVLAKMENYKEKLGLSDEQEVKVKAINTEYFESLEPLKKSNISNLSKYRQFKALREEKNKKMKVVLNEEQYKTYMEMQKEMKNNLKKRRKNEKG